MVLNEQIKILEDKIKGNKAQHELDQKKKKKQLKYLHYQVVN